MELEKTVDPKNNRKGIKVLSISMFILGFITIAVALILILFGNYKKVIFAGLQLK